MFRSLVGAVVVLVLGVSVTLAAEIRAVITKVDGDKVTFSENKGKGKGKAELGPAQTLPVADNVKVTQTKFDKDTKKLSAPEAVTGGLKNEMFSKIGEKGVGATIVTDADNKKITEIRVGGFGGFKKKKDK